MQNITNDEWRVNGHDTISLKYDGLVTGVRPDESAKFLALLDPDQDRFLFSSFDDDKDRAKLMRAKKVDGVPGSEKLATLAGATPWMNKRQALGANVCCAVQVMQGSKRTLESVVGYRAIFAEMDQVTTKPWPITPSIIVESSPGKHHFYWLIDSETPITGDTFEGIEKRLVISYGADNGAKDSARTLRLPGTWNLKPGRRPHLVRVIGGGGYRYTADELSAAFPLVPKEKPVAGGARPDFSRYRTRGDLGRFVDPLKTVSPDDYQDWLEVGMALHEESGGSREGLIAWNAWSATSAKWSEGECEYRWKTFRAGRGITGGKVFHLAELNGYRAPEKPVKKQTKAKKAITSETVYSPPVDEFFEQPVDLILSDRGTPKPILANAIALLRSSPDWAGAIAFDEFSQRSMLMKRPPWGGKSKLPRDWTGRDDLLATEWMQRQGVSVGLDVVRQSVEAVAGDNAFHPVRQYLSALTWDRTPRIEKLASLYFGAEESPNSRNVSRCFMIAAVARIFEPGCKADNVLIIEGNQGDKKSSGFKALAGGQWFTDEFSDLGSKDAGIQMQGVWIIEMAELDNLNRSEAGRAKAFFSRSTDRFRPPYGVRAVDFPRQCLFVGTTNKDDYLKDETGARRYWPVRGGAVDMKAISRDRDQLWAEAVHLYKAGVRWWLEGEEKKLAEVEQDARQPGDSWEDRVTDYTDGRAEVTIADILSQALFLDAFKQDQIAQNRVSRILKVQKTDAGRAVWERRQKRLKTGKRTWVYLRIDLSPV